MLPVGGAAPPSGARKRIESERGTQADSVSSPDGEGYLDRVRPMITISVTGATLIAEILAISMLVIAFETRDAMRPVARGRYREFVRWTGNVSLGAAAITIIICVVGVSSDKPLEMGWAIVVALGSLISAFGTGVFLDRALRTMFKSPERDAKGAASSSGR